MSCPRVIIEKVEGFFSLPLDGGGLGWGSKCWAWLHPIPLPPTPSHRGKGIMRDHRLQRKVFVGHDTIDSVSAGNLRREKRPSNSFAPVKRKQFLGIEEEYLVIIMNQKTNLIRYYMQRNNYNKILLSIFFIVLILSAIKPHDYFTWFLEVVPEIMELWLYGM